MNDLISRKAVLDYIDSMPSELANDGRRMIRRVRLTEYISELPSAEITYDDVMDYCKPRHLALMAAEFLEHCYNHSSAQRVRKWEDLIDTFNYELTKIAKDYYDDPENSHYYSDILMVDTLKDLGFDLQPFDDMCKWYA